MMMEERKENNNFQIYIAQNTINGYVYVGATSKTIDERKKDHLLKTKKEYKNKFHKAISTYGAEAFKWEQVDTASSFDDLARKEKEYVLKYNSKEAGYNSDLGGGIKKTVYQYDTITGKLLNKYADLKDASNAINATKKAVSKACLGVNKKYKGYYWSYDYKEPFEPNIDKRKKCVVQYAITGKIIKTFKSVAEASEKTGFNKSSIAKVCRGERKSCGGYLWSY